MKVVIGTKSIERSLQSMNYGDTCTLPQDKKVYMYLKTTQSEVYISKKDHIAQKFSNTKKLLDLETGQIKCVDSSQKVIPINVVAYVGGD